MGKVMTVRMADDRLHGWLSGPRYRTSRVCRELLDGDRSWGGPLKRTEKYQFDRMLKAIVADGFKIRLASADVIEIATKVPLPPHDPFLDRFMAQWRLDTLPVLILSLDHVEDRHGIPICKSKIFGTTGGDGVAAEPARYGLQETYIVGRLDVAPEKISLRRHMRPTLRRARNTADQIARMLPEWDLRQARLARLARIAAEDAAAEASETPFDDEEADEIAAAFG